MDTNGHGGHTFHNTSIGGDARVHMGNVYNLSEADSTEQRILEWLSIYNPSSSHDRACKQYQAGTLDSFFESDIFQKWCEQRNSPLFSTLWCRGGPGTGKTTLVAQIVRHLQSRGIRRNDLAVIYCRYAERGLMTAEALLGSILAQLYQQSKTGFAIPTQVKEMYAGQPRLASRRPDLAELKAWLSHRSSFERPVFVLLDALDELDPLQMRMLLQALRVMAHGTLKLLTTSRDVANIGKELHGLQVRDIQIRAEERDLIALINARFNDLGNEEFRTHILRTPGRLPGQTMAQEIFSYAIRSANGRYVSSRKSPSQPCMLIKLGFFSCHFSSMPLHDVRGFKTSIYSWTFHSNWILCTIKPGKEQLSFKRCLGENVRDKF